MNGFLPPQIRKKSRLLSQLLLSTPLLSHAEVILFNGAYRLTLDDGSDKALPAWVRLRRQYHSRSLHRGILGFGWCAEYEKTLRISPQQLVLVDCLAGQDLVFHFRQGRYWRQDLPQESITQRKNRYVFTARDGSILSFNLQGRLIEILKPGKKTTLDYDSHGELNRIRFSSQDGRTDSAAVEIDPHQHLLKVIRLPRGDELHFIFKNDDLREVYLNKKLRETYAYDDFHNMVRSQVAMQTELITYDEAQDIVTRLLDHQGCLSEFTYRRHGPPEKSGVAKTEGFTEQDTEVTRSCAQQKTQKLKVNFKFNRQKDKRLCPQRERSLSQITVQQNRRISTYVVNDKAQLVPLAERRAARVSETLTSGGTGE